MATWRDELRQLALEFLTDARTEVAGPVYGQALLALLAHLDRQEAQLDALQAEMARFKACPETSAASQAGYDIGWEDGYCAGEGTNLDYEEGWHEGYAAGQEDTATAFWRVQEN